MPSLHRFYLPAATANATTLRLAGREAHHALDVLRLGRGDAVTVLDGVGNIFACEISVANRAEIELAVQNKKNTPALPGAVTLLAAIPKGKIETIIEKATELGVTRVVPLLTERTVVKIDAASAADKVEKWQQVAIEAIKQCGSPWLPHIELPLTPAQFLARGEQFDLPLVASLQPDSTDARVAFQNFAATHRRPPQTVCLWIGPEGDFSPAEYATLRDAGILPITLGSLVLRADTAAIAGLALLRHELRG